MTGTVYNGVEVYHSPDSNVEEEDELNKKEGYILRNGQATSITHHGGLMSSSFEYDYEDISSNGSFSFKEVNSDIFYKGQKVCLKKGYDAKSWKDLEDGLLGFITNQVTDIEETTITMGGMTKLLDKKKELDFSNIKRADIISQIIETAGLKPVIDVTGLKNDVTSFSSVSKTETSSSASIGNSSIPELAKEVCKGKKTDAEKAQAIHTYIRDHVDYPPGTIYSNHRKCPKEALESGICNCCDRARIGHEMANAVGLKNQGVLATDASHVWIQYYINGNWVNSDPGVSRPDLGAVWNDLGVGSIWDFPEC